MTPSVAISFLKVILFTKEIELCVQRSEALTNKIAMFWHSHNNFPRNKEIAGKQTQKIFDLSQTDKTEDAPISFV